MAEHTSSIADLAAACAGRIPRPARSFHEDRPAFDAAVRDLLDAVRHSNDRFAFDLAGRPAALAAIRQALPAVEAELLDAVLEDVACELAAAQEALYQVVLAVRE